MTDPMENKLDKETDGECTWESIRGAVPNMTDGLSSEEFVRKQRDEWDD